MGPIESIKASWKLTKGTSIKTILKVFVALAIVSAVVRSVFISLGVLSAFALQDINTETPSIISVVFLLFRMLISMSIAGLVYARIYLHLTNNK